MNLTKMLCKIRQKLKSIYSAKKPRQSIKRKKNKIKKENKVDICGWNGRIEIKF